MADERDYLDENGHDLRYGEYYAGAWCPDPPRIIESKQSGEWHRLGYFQRRWLLESCCRPAPEEALKLAEMGERIRRYFSSGGSPRK